MNDDLKMSDAQDYAASKLQAKLLARSFSIQ